MIAVKSSPLGRYTKAFSLWAGTRSGPVPAFRERGWVSVYSLCDWFHLRPAGEANICVRSWDRKLLRGLPEQRASITQLRDSEVWTGAVCQQPSAVNSVPWCRGEEGGGIRWLKSPDHAVIRSDLNGGRYIWDRVHIGSVWSVSCISLGFWAAEVWVYLWNNQELMSRCYFVFVCNVGPVPHQGQQKTQCGQKHNIKPFFLLEWRLGSIHKCY